MNEQTDLDRELRRYLLGDMTSEESFRLEESLDRVAMFEQFEVAEQNLIEDYLMHRLTASDRERFEDNYLADSVERLQRVAQVKAILKVVPKMKAEADAHRLQENQHEAKKVPFIPAAMPRPAALAGYVAGIVILFVGVVYFKYQRSSYKGEIDQIHRQLEETQNERDKQNKELVALKEENDELKRKGEELTQENGDLLARLETLIQTDSIPRISLSPFGVKGTQGEQPRSIGRNIKRISLQLELRPDLPYEDYDVRINGKLVADHLRPRPTSKGQVIRVTVASALLREGPNAIELSGRTKTDYQPVDGYSMEIRKSK